jgi:acyl carrier protein
MHTDSERRHVEDPILYEVIREVVLDSFSGVDAIVIDDDLWQMGLTSIDSVRIMVAVEERFDIEFPEESLTRETFSSVRRISDVVTRVVSRSEARKEQSDV